MFKYIFLDNTFHYFRTQLMKDIGLLLDGTELSPIIKLTINNGFNFSIFQGIFLTFCDRLDLVPMTY